MLSFVGRPFPCRNTTTLPFVVSGRFHSRPLSSNKAVGHDQAGQGEIASLSGAGDGPRYFQISVPVQPGNSGGALVDEHGNVIGIVSAKLDEAAALTASGSLPENVNYAVKSSLL